MIPIFVNGWSIHFPFFHTTRMKDRSGCATTTKEREIHLGSKHSHIVEAAMRSDRHRFPCKHCKASSIETCLFVPIIYQRKDRVQVFGSFHLREDLGAAVN